MAMKGINNTTTSNFESIIGSRNKFIIPKFQRDYSWDLEQWDDLWQDIENAKNDCEEHYMGYLVLQSDSKEKKNYIIDGQQRFTTITMIILAAIKSIKKLVEKGVDIDDNNERIEKLMESYIGYKNPISLAYDNILHLNRNNNSYYKDYIVKMGELRTRGILASEKLMKKCFEFYENKLTGKFKTGEEYAEFITFIVDKLYFTVITVSDEMNAFKVFETLNARGVQLSSSDLLKNYLFSLIDQTNPHCGLIAELEEKWIKLTSNVREQKLPEFIRYYWNSKNKTIRANELFKEIRNKITKNTQVFAMVDEMIAYSDVYMALQNHNDEYWNSDKEIADNVYLLNTFGIKQAFPLLMSANKNLPIEQFKQALKDVVVISFRYNVICGKNPNDIEKVYNTIANMVTKDKSYSKTKLQKVYIIDSEFVGAFNNKVLVENPRNNKIIKYILNKIEIHNGGISADIHDPTNTVEHILPQNPNEDWIIEADYEQYIYRLGNMCLLEKDLNKNIANKLYEEKKEVYLSSNFYGTKNIATDYEEWSIQNINTRQSQMGKVAKGIWNIQF